MPPPFPQRAYSFAEYLYFTIHHKNWLLKVEGVDSYFFSLLASEDKSIFTATKFVQQLRETICLRGWYTPATWKAETVGGKKLHGKCLKYRAGWRACCCTAGRWWFWKTNQQEKKIPTDETSGISSSPPLSEGQTQQLAITASQAVLLYWPGELIIDCEPSAYKYACKLLKY